MSAPTSSHGAETIVLGALVAGAVALAVIWLGGGLAGALFGQGWPAIQPSGLAGVLARLPLHMGDPRYAWPAPVRYLLPGTGGLIAGLGLAAAALAPLAWLITRLVTRAARAAGPAGAGARWAGPGELRPLHSPLWSPGRPEGRIALGRRSGRILYGEQRHALIAFGPPQSGKSAGLAIPALLEWEGPAIASSIKTDLLDATAARRGRLGETMVFDPFQLSGAPGATWSPLRLARTWEGALEVAWRLTSSAELDGRGVEGGEFWAVAAEQRLAPLLFAAARAELGMDRVVAWAYGQRLRELDASLERAAQMARGPGERDDAQAAYDAARAFHAQADRTRSSIEATAQTLLRAYRFGRVLRSAQSCQITPDRLLQSANTLYLIGDAKSSKLLRPLFLALVSEVIDAAYAEANRSGGRLELPLLVCLDEAGNVAPLPNLAEIASTAPSHHIQLLTIFHDIAQARSRYGQQAETVVNSHRARMLLPGVADLETLRYFAGLVGEEEMLEVTRTIGSGGPTRSTSRRRRPLIAPEALRQLPDGSALLLYGRLAPVQIRLRRWFAERSLRRLARG
ncbi:MAG TPA: type IV secretory system conjugative DNA transfer family protein [Solirubrobacteraceae bacterium]|nr:type IV secretory system conjugative DNA transfer family protein [Solirubrobacteraceae bacterium]